MGCEDGRPGTKGKSSLERAAKRSRSHFGYAKVKCIIGASVFVASVRYDDPAHLASRGVPSRNTGLRNLLSSTGSDGMRCCNRQVDNYMRGIRQRHIHYLAHCSLRAVCCHHHCTQARSSAGGCRGVQPGSARIAKSAPGPRRSLASREGWRGAGGAMPSGEMTAME